MFISELDYHKSLNDAVSLLMLKPDCGLIGAQLKVNSLSINSKKFERSSSQLELNLNLEDEKIGSIVFFFVPDIFDQIDITVISDELVATVDKISKSLESNVILARTCLLNTLLEKLNYSLDLGQTVRDILTTIKITTDFDAVGIRFKEGYDYPYYEVFGFENNFVEAENFLCSHDDEGKPATDDKGNSKLDCMCGNVIRGQIDSSYPFFTEGGSFWTNSTTELLSSTTEEERQAETRNRCNTAGYESVALIPLRAESEIKGLLQINNKSKNSFSLEMIIFFERVSALIAVAIERYKLTERLKHKEQLLEGKLEELERKKIASQEIIKQFAICNDDILSDYKQYLTSPPKSNQM